MTIETIEILILEAIGHLYVWMYVTPVACSNLCSNINAMTGEQRKIAIADSESKYPLSRVFETHVGSTGRKLMHLQPGLEMWRRDRAKINEKTQGIVWVAGVILHRFLWASPTQWASLALPRDRLDSFTEWYVFGVMLLSVGIYVFPSVLLALLRTYFSAISGIYFVPSVWVALLGTYFSASTVIVMLHIVLLQRVFGPIASAERSLLLFMCNVVQIVFMFATWYRWAGEPGPLLTSVLTFATIGYAKTMPRVAMAQIATDFVLLLIFLGFLLGQLGPKNGAK